MIDIDQEIERAVNVTELAGSFHELDERRVHSVVKEAGDDVVHQLTVVGGGALSNSWAFGSSGPGGRCGGSLVALFDRCEEDVARENLGRYICNQATRKEVKI